jgi:hypothetical protein
MAASLWLKKILNGHRYQCLFASDNGHAATSRACTKIMAMLDSVLCVYCHKNQAQYIPRNALGPCCGNPYLQQLIQGQSQGCWEQAKKDGWEHFNQKEFEKRWEAKMALMRKSSENLTLHALDSSITCKIASYIFGRPELERNEATLDEDGDFCLYTCSRGTTCSSKCLAPR